MKKTLAILGSAAMLMMGAAGCSKETEEAQKNLNKSVIDAINSSSQISAITDMKLDNFEFLAADISSESGMELVDINGIADITGKDKKAYVSMQYELENAFAGIDSSKSEEVINRLNEIVQTYEISDFDCVFASKIQDVNKAMGNVFKSPIEGFDHSESLTYSVKNLTFNMEEGYFAFDTASNVHYQKVTPEVKMMYQPDGKGGLIYRSVTTAKVEDEKFNEYHQIAVKASREELEKMQQDSSLAMDKFVETINSKKSGNYAVNRVDIQEEKSINDGSEFSL